MMQSTMTSIRFSSDITPLRTSVHKPSPHHGSVRPALSSKTMISCEGSSKETAEAQNRGVALSRRDLMRSAALSTMAGVAGPLGGLGLGPSLAFTPPPPGLRLQKDKLDGYSFFFPEEWVKVTSTAADIFYRSIDDIETNVFVEFSSPSSSKYQSVSDLGSPMDAAERIKAQYLKEFMSSRIGVRRYANIVSAEERVGPDGMLFYNISVNITSYADSNQFGITPEERIPTLEFDRRLFTTLGVSNNQLYEMRLQTPESKVAQQEGTINTIMESLRLFPPTVN